MNSSNLMKNFSNYTKIMTSQYVFHTLFTGKDMDKLTPYEWLPKWSGDMINPSGRLISAFNS